MKTENVILVLPEWERTKKGHENQVGNLQTVVDKLTVLGLEDVTVKDIEDLTFNHGKLLNDKAEKFIRKNAGAFILPATRSRIIEENMKEYSVAFSNARIELERIFQVRSGNPLTADAYIIKKGVVSLSDEWVEQLKESHTIRETPERQEALRLIAEVETAINNINAFVKDNKYFGRGITTWNDGRIALCYIGSNGDFYKQDEYLQYI